MKKDDSYRELKACLVEILAKMEDSDASLDDLMKLHQDGQKILAKLDAYLSDMRDQIAATIENK